MAWHSAQARRNIESQKMQANINIIMFSCDCKRRYGANYRRAPGSGFMYYH